MAQAQCTASTSTSGTLRLVGSGVASTANSILAVVNTMDTVFLAQGSAFVTSPASQTPDQLAGGVWGREVVGQSTTKSTGTADGAVVFGVPAGNLTCNTNVHQDFGGAQFGFDLGKLNFGGTGENIFFGLTAGYARSTAYDNNVAFSGSFEAPFLGAYSVFTYGNFFADVMLRGNFYQMQLENPLVSGS